MGETVRFQLTVTNVGYSTAYDIVVEDRLPRGFEYVKDSALLIGPGGRTPLEPVITEGSLLTWVTGRSLEAGESLVLVFAARVREEALGKEEVVNVMRAEGVDAFRTPIPADSRRYVPADDDPDDMDVLRLRVRAGATGPTGARPPRGPLGLLALSAAGLGGLIAARRRLGLLALLLALSLPAQAARYTVELHSDPPRAGILFGAGIYKAGELVQVSALPHRGFEFVGWFEDEEEVSLSPLFEFVADRNRRLVARFRPILEFLGLSGSSQGRLFLLPTTGLESTRVELRSRYQFGFHPWEFRGVAVFRGTEWRDAQFHFTGAWDRIRFGGGLLFSPTGPAYRSAYAMSSLPWEELRLGLRVTHYPSYGTPPGPALLLHLTAGLPPLTLTVRLEEKAALTLKDVTLSLHGVELCCGLALQGTLAMDKEGLAYLRLAAQEIPLGCCGLSMDLAVTFTATAKEVELTPRWLPYCDACLTVYGDVVWAEGGLQGLALYGYKIRCCFGAGCCPPGPGGYVEFLTAFDPARVPGGFKEGEFEYARFGFCGPACCGGTYRLELTLFFRPTGGLFGLARVLLQASLPLPGGWTLEPQLELPLSGSASLGLGWTGRF
ncbi:MAG: DUF11 domain-containing protein [Candidatus Bipolaricaulota bacterium]|nr:DUF11 domain-containing protein [Candidatus Bipolaricaulota bacterium]